MTAPLTPEFNLIDDPWIEVTMLDRSQRTLSLREVFAESATVQRISGDIATQDFAVLRLLIAISWRAYTRTGALPDYSDHEFADEEEWWLSEFSSGAIRASTIIDYLEEHRGRFWLVDPAEPFYQVADLSTSKGEPLGISRIVADAESDYFTSRAGAGLDSLSYAEAARWLLHAHAFDYSGIKPAALGDPRVSGGKGFPIGTGAAAVGGGVVVHGSTLAETLLLNLPATPLFNTAAAVARNDSHDVPAWERTANTAAPRAETASIPDGPIDALTWQSRRVRLYPEGGRITGVLITNGDKLELQNNRTDPFFSRQFSKNLSKQTSTVYLPRKHYSERTFWRGVESLMHRHTATPTELRSTTPTEPPANIEHLARLEDTQLQRTVNVELVGAEYGPQDAIVTNSIHTEIPLQLRLLTSYGEDWAPVIVQHISNTLSSATALGSFSGMLTVAAGGDYANDRDAVARVLATLEHQFRGWLLNLGTTQDPAQTSQAWLNTARSTIVQHANMLVTNAGPQAMQGRIILSAAPGKDPQPQLSSAGTARIWLLAQLKKYLPVPQTTEKAAS